MYGAGIEQARQCAVSHSLLSDSGGGGDGRKFCNLLKVRLNILPCKGSVAHRGDRLCRTGCGKSESLSHISQGCPSVHLQRTSRHDKILELLCKRVDTKKFSLMKENRFIVLKSTNSFMVIQLPSQVGFALTLPFRCLELHQII